MLLAARAALVHVDWRPLVGLPPTPNPRDPVERVITELVIEQAETLRQHELEWTASETARRL